MTQLRRIPVVWTGLTGLPGVSVFYSDFGDDPTGALGTFFTAIKSLFPSPLSWSIPAAGDVIEDTTGALTGEWALGTSATVTANGDSSYQAGGGAYVIWGTGGIRNSRRVRGKTFLAPLSYNQFDSSGTLGTTTRSTLQTAAAALAATDLLVIWSRPIPPSTSNGLSNLVTSANVPDQVTSLATRRR